MKKVIAFGLLLIMLILSGILLFTYSWIQQEPPQSVSVLENALATDDLLLISHIDFKKISTLKNFFDGTTDPQAIAIPSFDEGFIKKLQFGAPDLNTNLEHILISLNGSDENKPSIQLIMLGQFNWNNLEPILSSRYEIIKEEDHLFKLTKIPEVSDEFVCPDDKKSKPSTYGAFYLHLSENVLLVSTERNRIAPLVDRINSKSSASADIANWEKYRSNKLASLAIFNPLSATNAGSGMTKMIAQQMFAEVNTLHIGASVSLLGRGILLDSQIDANEAWLNKVVESIEKKLGEIDEQTSSTAPSFAKILSSISTEKKSNQLNVSFLVNAKAAKNARDTFEEVTSNLFSFGPGNASEQPNEEQIDKSPWDYKNNRGFANLQAFKIDDFWKDPQLIDGPFALGITNIAIGEKSDLLELTLNTKMQLPDDMSSSYESGAELQLKIDSVKNKKGQELLRDERCLKPKQGEFFYRKNHEPEEGFNSSNDKVYLNKTIRLNENTSLEEISSITGNLQFRAPSIIKAVTVSPENGTTIEEQGLRIFINKIKPQSVSYQLSGEKDNLIEVRALNKKGQVIRTNYSSSSGSPKIDRVSINYHGNIDTLVFFITEKFEHRDLDFDLSLNDFLKTSADENQQTSTLIEPETVSVDTWNSFSKIDLTSVDISKSRNYYSDDTPIIANFTQTPIKSQIRHKYDSWNRNLSFEILVPFIPELARNLSALELQVEQAEDNTKTTSKFVEIKPYTSNDVYQTNFDYEDLPLFLLKPNVATGTEEGQKITKLNGSLIIRLPNSIKRSIIQKPGFVESKSQGETDFYLRQINKEYSPGFTYEYKGDPTKFINIIAVTSAEQKIFPESTEFKEGKWSVRYSLKNDIDHFELLLAEEQSVIEYPFSLEPTYPDSE